MTQQLDTAAMIAKLRAKCVDVPGRKVLASNLALSAQASDLTLPPNCGGLGRVRHFRQSTDAGWPGNPLPRLPAEAWLKRTLPEPLRAQVFQLAGCAWRCWYCFVPFEDLRGHQSRAVWVTAAQLIEAYLEEADRPEMIDLSGGSPDLAPEWVAWTMDALEDRGLEKMVYLWSDDNLSSDQICTPANRALLRRLERFRGYGKVCCLKGFDADSFSFNTGGRPEAFDAQLRILDLYGRTDLDLYGYITLTARGSVDLRGQIRRLMDRIERARIGLLGRIVPLKITRFGAMLERVTTVREQALRYQEEVADVWTEELRERGVHPLWMPAESTLEH